MPKVLPSARRNRHQQRHHHHHHEHHQALPLLSSSSSSISTGPQHSNILVTAPRKVSFEDGHPSSSSFGSATSLTSSGGPPQQDTMGPIDNQGRSRLRRKAPSSCLAGLLEECASKEPNNSNCDDCLTSPHRHHDHLTTVSAPSSPWGHFVDILVPLDDDDDTSGSAATPLFDSSFCSNHHEPTFRSKQRHHHHHSTSSGSSSHPYGLLPRHARRRQLRQRQQQKSRPRSHSEGDTASFLPGFFFGEASPTTHRVPAAPASTILAEDTRSVETALQRLSVGTSD